MAEYILPTEETITKNILSLIISQALFMLDKNTPSDKGTNYKPLYYGLFNGITAILEHAATYEQTVAALKQLQCEAENAYIEQEENTI